MIRIWLKNTLRMLCVILTALGMAVCSHAAETSFTPSDEPDDNSRALKLAEASIEHGDGGIARNVLIELIFTKNVVNIAVMQNNLGCIHMVDAEEEPVEIEVIFPDDQLQQDNKRSIFVRPASPLEPLSAYTLYVDGNLLSKSSLEIDHVYIISFTTSGSMEEQSNPNLAALGDNIVVFTTCTGKTEYSIPVNAAIPDSAEPEKSLLRQPERLSAYIAAASGALLALLSAGLCLKALLRRREKRGDSP